MFSQSLLVLAVLCSSGNSLPFPQASTNTTRYIMRLTGTFSVSDPSDPSLGSRFGAPSRPANPQDAVITFKNGDTIISASPGQIDRSIAQGVTQLSLNIDQAIGGADGKSLSYDRNVIFSPASISMALALALLGARGRTADEIAKVLGIATPEELSEKGDLVHEQFGYLLSRFDRPNGPTQVSIANGIFIQRDYPISDRFERLSRSLYRSDIVPVDFRRDGSRAGSTINRWVEEKTNGRIRGFLAEPPSPQTQVLLANAIYFNGEWEDPFPIEATRKRSFYVTGSKQNEVGSEVVEVDMMANGLEVPYLSDSVLDCQLIALPYKGGRVAMWVALPNTRGYEGLNQLKTRLTSQALEDMISRATVTSTIVSMPRMKLEATINLRSVLQGLGMECLFDARCADLGAVTNSGGFNRPTSSNRPSNSNRPASGSRPSSTGASWTGNPSSTGGSTWQSNPSVPNSSSWQSNPSSTGSSNWQKNPSSAGSSSWQNNPSVPSSSSWSSNPSGASWSNNPSTTNRPTYRPGLADGQDSDVFIFSSRFGDGENNDAGDGAPTRETDRRRQAGVKGRRYRVARQSNPGLFVDDVVHKVEIEVTETGTVAAATTALSISRDGSHRNVRLDRPFLFFIRHADSRLVLFWGAVVRPTS